MPEPSTTPPRGVSPSPAVPRRAEAPLRVWLDDVRPVPDPGWTATRTAEETIALLAAHVVEDLSLDNDLGGHLTEGWTVARWMRETGLWPTGRVAVHSTNQRRRGRMIDDIDGSGIFERAPGRPGVFALIPSAFDLYRTMDVTIETPAGPVTAAYDAATPPELAGLLPLHVLTAWNPLSVDTDEVWNAAATERLASAIAATGGTTFACAGAGRDGKHEPEEGFAVTGIDRRTAVDLGRRFGQQAIFTIDERGQHVVPCAVVDRRWGTFRFPAGKFARPGRTAEFAEAFVAVAAAGAGRRSAEDDRTDGPIARLTAEVDPTAAEPAWVVAVAGGAQNVEVGP